MTSAVKSVTTICFKDLETGDEACVFVRVSGSTIALGSSVMYDGDVEVSFAPSECDRLIAGLVAARAEALRASSL